MKVLVLIVAFVLAFGWHKCNAQSKKGKLKSASMITLFLKSKSLIQKDRWSLCAGVTLNKNSLPYSQLGGNLLKRYHGSAPIYGSFALNKAVSLEGGAYFGVVAKRAEALGEMPLPVTVNQSLDLGFDSGLVSGISFDLGMLGEFNLRYNYGFSNQLNINEQAFKTRRLDMGVSIRF